MLLFIASLVLSAIVTYIFWIRPILRENPKLKHLYDREEEYFPAIKAKFAGIKGKLTVALTFIAASSIELYDWASPMLSGIDTTGISDKIPGWAWPLISFALVALMNYFRKLADKRKGEETA